jgi:hypothetical protein
MVCSANSSYSFNILQDVHTHNGDVHVHRILILIKLPVILRIFDENQNTVDMNTSIMYISILQNIKAVAPKLYEEIAGQTKQQDLDFHQIFSK